MIEILPIKYLREEDSAIFGPLNVSLGKLSRADIQVANGIVITAPEIHLNTVLEHYDFGHKKVFEQSLTLVKKEIEKTPVPEILVRETKGHGKFSVDGEVETSVKLLWLRMLFSWLEEIKKRLWDRGFYPGITENLQPQIVVFVSKVEGFGNAHFDPIQDGVVINVQRGKIEPNDKKKLAEIVEAANKKLFIPHEYEWIIEGGVKLTKLLQHTPIPNTPIPIPTVNTEVISIKHLGGVIKLTPREIRSAVKVFLDLSTGLVVEREVDGIYISSEKIFDLNKPQSSFEELVFKLVESASTFPDSPILVKLADMSEGMGKVRGALRLIHQKSLLDPLCEAVLFARNKKELRNIHVVIPFVRGVNELIQIKRDLAVKKLMRKNNLEIWLEIAVPENIVNLEDYLTQGIDGVVLNLDELSAHFAGYDATLADVAFYKHEVSGLLKFLEDGIKLLHKSKASFIAYGSLSLNPAVLEFLVEKGVYGLVVERYEAPSMTDLLHQAEKRMILRKTT